MKIILAVVSAVSFLVGGIGSRFLGKTDSEDLEACQKLNIAMMANGIGSYAMIVENLDSGEISIARTLATAEAKSLAMSAKKVHLQFPRGQLESELRILEERVREHDENLSSKNDHSSMP